MVKQLSFMPDSCGSSDCRRGFACLLVLVLVLTIAACAPGNQPADLQTLLSWPQEPAVYIDSEAEDKILMSLADQSSSAQLYLARHFLPWGTGKVLYDSTRVFGDVENLKKAKLFGETLRPRPKDWITSLLRECNRQAYPSLDRKGVTVRSTNLRMLPTHRPGFLDPAKAGEGFPFDQLQYSSLWANTPVHVSHATADSSWYFVETAHVFGWAEAEDLAFVSDELAERIISLPLAAIIRDNMAVLDGSGHFLFQGRIGMLLPVLKAEERGLTCLALRPDQGRQAVVRTVRLNAASAASFPIKPAATICARIADAFLGQAYGWGGLFENRDCSAFMRDFFTPFGIWLPRNSAQQAGFGRFIDLENESAKDKERIIVDRGVPFLTMVTMPGHIMLYIGSRDGRAAVQHTVWGLRIRDFLGRKGRLVIGQNVITSLAPGKGISNLDRPEGELLHRVTGMTLLDSGVREREAASFNGHAPQ